MTWKQRLYRTAPVFAQNWICTYEGSKRRRERYGDFFFAKLASLEESQWWERARLVSYQDEQLQALIEHAYQHVPYYRDLFDRLHLKPSDIQSRHDLPKLPVLTKEEYRAHLPELIAAPYTRTALIHGHTSGSTGKSLDLYMEPEAIQFTWAVWWRHKQRYGVAFDSPYATFTGLNAVPLGQTKPPYWRENRAMKQTIFTMHHITPAKIRPIVERLNKGDFVYYSGYPSILHTLANLIERSGLAITRPPKMIFTGAETLYDDQRQQMARVFGAPVTDQYGFSEGCGNASRCPEEDVFHEDFEYGILECDNPTPIDADHYSGDIIATGFRSRALPFIRYKVGDVGVWSRRRCSCGRHSDILTRIEGRVEDYVVTPEGARILRFDYIFKDTHNVEEAQVVQRRLGAITLRLVRRHGYSAADERLLIDEIHSRISPRLAVEFEYVDAIEREPNGKFRAVRSYLRAPLVGEQV